MKTPEPEPKPLLCIDFDGCVTPNKHGWQGVDVINEQVMPGFFDWALKAREHFRLVIISPRVKEIAGLKALLNWMGKQLNEAYPWMMDKALTPLSLGDFEFTHERLTAFLTIDDRALTFEGDWSKFDPQWLKNYRPWSEVLNEPIRGLVQSADPAEVDQRQPQQSADLDQRPDHGIHDHDGRHRLPEIETGAQKLPRDAETDAGQVP